MTTERSTNGVYTSESGWFCASVQYIHICMHLEASTDLAFSTRLSGWSAGDHLAYLSDREDEVIGRACRVLCATLWNFISGT